MGKIIALANQKGGVGKTTTTINLAASLATLEKTVLVLDADPQANASSGLGVDIKEVDCSVYECIIDHADIRDAIYTTDIEGLDIVPSHIDLVGAEIEMLNMKDREKVLKGLLQPIRDEYDYILIDCSPSLGLITVNALTAADSVIIPVQCEYFALEGISKLLNTIKIIKSKLNPKLEIEGFLLTMYDSRLRLARQIYDEVKRHFQELVFRTVIQRNVKLSESPSHGLPVILYDAAYECFITDEHLARSIFEIEGARECAIEICSFSKIAGFTGTRCGYTIVPKELEREGMNLNKLWLRRQTTKFNGVPYVVQRAAAAVFTESGMAEIQQNLDYYRQNAKVIADALDACGVWYCGGKNSPYIWLRCPGNMKSWEFFDWLLENCGVVGTPGVGFGECGEGYFRLTAFGDAEKTKMAAERIKTAIKAL